MSEGRGDHTHNFNDMLYGSHEKYEIHAVTRIQIIVFFELRVAYFFNVISIGELAVDVSEHSSRCVAIRIQCWHEGRPQKRLYLYKTIPVSFEILLDDGFHELLKHSLIVVVDETILEDAHALVCP
jgi:hypothetical protein